MERSATEPQRIETARAFLDEAVYRSREVQAARSSLGPEAGCGLGEGPLVELELSERARALAFELWPTPLAEPARAHVDEILGDWVRRQDAFDRKRNHFMRDFRSRHGFDRRAYAPEILRAYEAGLDAIHRELDEARAAAARALAAIR